MYKTHIDGVHRQKCISHIKGTYVSHKGYRKHVTSASKALHMRINTWTKVKGTELIEVNHNKMKMTHGDSLNLP